MNGGHINTNLVITWNILYKMTGQQIKLNVYFSILNTPYNMPSLRQTQ